MCCSNLHVWIRSSSVSRLWHLMKYSSVAYMRLYIMADVLLLRNLFLRTLDLSSAIYRNVKSDKVYQLFISGPKDVTRIDYLLGSHKQLITKIWIKPLKRKVYVNVKINLSLVLKSVPQHMHVWESAEIAPVNFPPQRKHSASPLQNSTD
jgi:hypothetical protein